MAAFRIREAALTWLSDVQKSLPDGKIFDVYYFCVMAGLSSGSREEITGSSREMVDYFVNDYKPAASFIQAMLVVAELKRARIGLSEDAEVRNMIRNLIDGQVENGLTTEGMNRLNAYANGGYEYLAKHIEQRPQSAEEFLRIYSGIVDEAVASGPFAN